VIVLGRDARGAQALNVSVDLGLDLGPRLFFKGRGIDTRLARLSHISADNL
jgi:autotransporter translocation and assembly factor TamB